MEKRNIQFVEEEHTSELSRDHDEGGREIAGNKEMSASYKKCVAKQAGIFPGFTAHK